MDESLWWLLYIMQRFLIIIHCSSLRGLEIFTCFQFGVSWVYKLVGMDWALATNATSVKACYKQSDMVKQMGHLSYVENIYIFWITWATTFSNANENYLFMGLCRSSILMPLWFIPFVALIFNVWMKIFLLCFDINIGLLWSLNFQFLIKY